MAQPLPRRSCFNTSWPPRASQLEALRPQRPHHRWVVDVGFEANRASIPKRPHIHCRHLELLPGGSCRPSRMAHGYNMITGITELLRAAAHLQPPYGSALHRWMFPTMQRRAARDGFDPDHRRWRSGRRWNGRRGNRTVCGRWGGGEDLRRVICGVLWRVHAGVSR